MISPEEKKSIVFALRDLRREALTKFISELMGLLKQEGFSFEDLIEAQASWAHQEPTLHVVVNHLEDAAIAAHHVTAGGDK